MVKNSNRSCAGFRNFAKRARKDSDESNERRDFTDLNDLNRSIEEISSFQQEQKETSLSSLKEFRNIGTQTEETANYRFTEIHKNFNNNNIRDLICILIDVVPISKVTCVKTLLKNEKNFASIFCIIKINIFIHIMTKTII